eukprot:s1940_g5.t1
MESTSLDQDRGAGLRRHIRKKVWRRLRIPSHSMLDLDEITEDIGLGRFQLLQQLLVSGVRLADGAEILISSAVLSILQQEWELSPALKGSMMSIIFIGVFFGNLMGGPAADAYGRRLAVLLAYFGLVFCGLCSAISIGPMSMLTARFFFGLFYGFGMGPSLTLQVEICPKAWRGHMVNVNNFFFTLGEVYAAWLLWAFLKDLKQTSDEELESWRYVTALAVSPALLILPFAVLLLYESPHYLVVCGKHDQAVQGRLCRSLQPESKKMERKAFSRTNDIEIDGMGPLSDSDCDVQEFAAQKKAMATLARRRGSYGRQSFEEPSRTKRNQLKPPARTGRELWEDIATDDEEPRMIYPSPVSHRQQSLFARSTQDNFPRWHGPKAQATKVVPSPVPAPDNAEDVDGLCWDPIGMGSTETLGRT